MGLADVLTAYANLVSDVLVNDCGAPLPGRILRYHGPAPDDMECSTDGILSVWWDDLNDSDPKHCAGVPQVVLGARWVRCWKQAEVDQGTMTLFDETWDADAALFADSAECVARVLMQLACVSKVPGSVNDDKMRALLDIIRAPVFLGARRHGPQSNAAGVDWRLRVGLRAVSTETS